MLAKEVKTGTVVVHDGNPVMIQDISVQSPSARGAATLYKFRARNVVTRNKVDITMKGTDVLQEADFSRRDVQLMYTDADNIYLMDKEDFQQYELSLGDVQDQLPYITEDLDGIRVLIYNDACVGLDVPVAVELTITQCDPGVKGNSATSRSKPATRLSKALIKAPFREALARVMREEGEVFIGRLGSPENVEAFTAFAQKRAPDFSRF